VSDVVQGNADTVGRRAVHRETAGGAAADAERRVGRDAMAATGMGLDGGHDHRFAEADGSVEQGPQAGGVDAVVVGEQDFHDFFAVPPDPRALMYKLYGEAGGQVNGGHRRTDLAQLEGRPRSDGLPAGG